MFDANVPSMERKRETKRQISNQESSRPETKHVAIETKRLAHTISPRSIIVHIPEQSTTAFRPLPLRPLPLTTQTSPPLHLPSSSPPPLSPPSLPSSSLSAVHPLPVSLNGNRLLVFLDMRGRRATIEEYIPMDRKRKAFYHNADIRTVRRAGCLVGSCLDVLRLFSFLFRIYSLFFSQEFCQFLGIEDPNSASHECRSFLEFVAIDRIFNLLQIVRTLHVRRFPNSASFDHRDEGSPPFPPSYSKHFPLDALFGLARATFSCRKL